eukprot:12443370-Heterocapsa_arctica.AAC.1
MGGKITRPPTLPITKIRLETLEIGMSSFMMVLKEPANKPGRRARRTDQITKVSKEELMKLPLAN